MQFNNKLTPIQPYNRKCFRNNELISRDPLDRFDLINSLCTPYKEGDLIFSVRWSPSPEQVNNIYDYSPQCTEFMEAVEHFLSIICYELSETNNGIEPDHILVYEQSGYLLNQAHMIISLPANYESRRFNTDHLLNLWSQANNEFHIRTKSTTIQANGKVLDVNGWVSNMIKPYRSNTDIFISVAYDTQY